MGDRERETDRLEKTPRDPVATTFALEMAGDRSRGAPRTRIPWVLRTELALLQASTAIAPGLATLYQLACFPTAKGRFPGVTGQAEEGPRKKPITHASVGVQSRLRLGTDWGHVDLINILVCLGMASRTAGPGALLEWRSAEATMELPRHTSRL